MADVLCFGDLLIDFVPTESGLPLSEVETFRRAPGGAAANVAVGLGRLGVKSAFMGKVGDDVFGHFLAETLRADGVDVGPLRFDARARTALAFVSLKADGDRDFMFYRHPSADMLYTPAEVDRTVVEAARIFHFDGLSLPVAQPRETALYAADLARAAGIPVSFDVNLRLPLWPDAETARAILPEGIRRAAIVKASEEEVAVLTGASDPEAARRGLWHDGMRLLVITRGAAGCRALLPDGEVEVPTIKTLPVDTTGAGDAFLAALLASVLRDPECLHDPARLRSACRFANVAGALTTLQRGAIPAIPTRAAVEEALRAAGETA